MNFIPQKDQMDCGPASLGMVSSYYGKNYPIEYLRENSFLTKEGVSMLGITEAAHTIGFETFPARLTLEKLKENKDSLPVILYWNQNHFVVLIKITKNFLTNTIRYKIADPAHGIITLQEEQVKKSWLSGEDMGGVALFLQPTEKFYELIPPEQSRLTVKYLFKYLTPFKKQLVFLFFMLLLGSGITLIFPFLAQNLIDKGVNVQNLNMVSIILLAQLALFFGSITIEIIRNWLMLYVGTQISITIISDFLKKMLKLPIKFFDTKMMGDFTQRIQDNERIENFLTSQSLLTFFSIITFSVFFGVLWYYNFTILWVYLLMTFFSVGWSFFWFKKRKILDYYRFQERSNSQESIYEILNGVTEMKLNQFDEYKRKKWENIQQKLFKLNIRILKVDQIQLSGFEFINQLKNIIVTFLAAILVIKGNISLGTMLSISYIIGQMNAPVNQLVNFFRSLQDARLSLERLNEVQNHPEEEQEEYNKFSTTNININVLKRGFELKSLSFQYEGPHSPYILQNLNVLIPEGKITAIVGASGSGKTTLMKILLKFYNPTSGKIFLNEQDLVQLSPGSLREKCGVVMQEGFIFSDTIERNIITKDEIIDINKFEQATRIANIDGFISSFPLKYNTKIGASGVELSGGQKQRILIARAVYKNPEYLFFDEATSALDSENERIIHANLQEFFKGKTVIIIAHRLSTVKNADQIVVLKNGQIVETGNHSQLVKLRSNYYNLVKNQLELGT
ncbi:peptidase domain-containing ABC transporter [Apibacter sp. B2912]|uniref:peptidase domain-containing ABC transporter n=1 Tax=Apibacter sp. B2912 TaxID=2656763 RepID=UPI00136C7B95|nr:peptidase domain-containing ABC transporter [Apibacter sp. B2912]MXO33102.1 ATP-binding cassette domain-containing protein [Apibacter sp. B2912]